MKNRERILFSSLMQCRRDGLLLESTGKKKIAANKNTEKITRWRRKRWMTIEGMRSVDRMLYQTGRLPSLFRIRMCVRLTYSCTRTASRYPFYSPFRVSSSRTRIHAHFHRKAIEEYACITKGWRKMENRGGRKHIYQQSTVYKVHGSIIMFARPRFKSIPVGIDLWSWDERVFTYNISCIFYPCSLPLLSTNIHWLSEEI